MVPPPSPYRHPHPHPLFPQKNVSDSTLKPQDSSLGNDVEEKAANQSSKTRDFFLKLRQALTFHHSAVKHSKTPLATLIRQQTAPFKEKNKMMKKGGGTGEDRNAFVYRGGFGSVIVLKNIDLSSSSAASAFSLESTAPALLSSSPLSPVVVKVLSRSTRERWADFHDRVEREVDCQSAVKSHPNIISPPHLVFWGGKMKRRRAYIVMDRIIGHNLDFEMIDARLASGMEGETR